MATTHPLLDATFARHGIPVAAVERLTIEARPDSVTVCGPDGERIESIDQLRRHAGLTRRWQPLVVAAGPRSTREQAVEELVRRGYTSAQIAGHLGVSVRTVTAERARLREQMPVTGVGLADDPSIVCVAGRPSLLRDLVHDCLVGADVSVAATPGHRPAASVVVAVEPGPRDFDVRPGARIVSCGSPPDSLGMTGAVRRGLIAVIPEVPTPEALVVAVRDALGGRVTMATGSIQELVEELYVHRAGAVTLSPRDHDVLEAIRDGESMKQTARRLGISQKTVENLRRQLYQKLGARTAAEALALADRAGLMPTGARHASGDA